MNIAIFASGSGTNCENIIRHFADNPDINVALVLSNKAEAYVLVRAANHGVPTAVLPKSDFSQKEKLMPLLRKYDIQFIVLAGFLLMVPQFLIDEYHHRMINIHPSLLPKYGGRGMYGMHVHEAIWKARETETGMTVHWVSPVCDGGQIIVQYRTPLTPDDTPETIAEKEHYLEKQYFPKTIEQIIKGEL